MDGYLRALALLAKDSSWVPSIKLTVYKISLSPVQGIWGPHEVHIHMGIKTLIYIFFKKDCKMDRCLFCTLTYVIGHILDTG